MDKFLYKVINKQKLASEKKNAKNKVKKNTFHNYKMGVDSACNQCRAILHYHVIRSDATIYDNFVYFYNKHLKNHTNDYF